MEGLSNSKRAILHVIYSLKDAVGCNTCGEVDNGFSIVGAIGSHILNDPTAACCLAREDDQTHGRRVLIVKYPWNANNPAAGTDHYLCRECGYHYEGYPAELLMHMLTHQAPLPLEYSATGYKGNRIPSVLKKLKIPLVDDSPAGANIWRLGHVAFTFNLEKLPSAKVR